MYNRLQPSAREVVAARVQVRRPADALPRAQRFLQRPLARVHVVRPQHPNPGPWLWTLPSGPGPGLGPGPSLWPWPWPFPLALALTLNLPSPSPQHLPLVQPYQVHVQHLRLRHKPRHLLRRIRRCARLPGQHPATPCVLAATPCVLAATLGAQAATIGVQAATLGVQAATPCVQARSATWPTPWPPPC